MKDVKSSIVLVEAIEVGFKYSRTTHHRVADQSNSTISDFIQFSALSEIGTISIRREVPFGKFSSEKLLKKHIIFRSNLPKRKPVLGYFSKRYGLEDTGSVSDEFHARPGKK
ncbi:hypothetical protein AVEN_215790-1 [Araneus ventricosus]|uniref:Uncharacterized protein n=1 Tax=Araneus ventricosus TaxID=182803 RepID=A0A4Y2J6T5_ARAVE|nr:hypothetical protein AVEN_215790-1 [Araneus ventricosus]